MSSQASEPEDAELLELLLVHGLQESLRRLAVDGRSARAAELRALDAFLTGCRAELAPTPAPRLVERVLARTTRQDLRLRGDLALVLRFCRDALAASPLMRAAAALLLLPLLGAPLLAWLVLRAPKRELGFRTRIEAQQVEPFLPAVPEGPADEIEFVTPDGLLGGPIDSQIPLIVNAPGTLSAARARAASAEAQADLRLPRVASQGALAHALDQRATAWNSALPSQDLIEADSGLLRALRVEALLDRWARSQTAPPELDQALAALGRDASEPVDVLRLEALALDRALSFGRVDADAWARLARAGARPGERGLSPVDRRWRASLAAALAHSPEGRELLAEPGLAGWLHER